MVLLPQGYKSWEESDPAKGSRDSRPMRFREQEEQNGPRSLGQMLEDKTGPDKSERPVVPKRAGKPGDGMLADLKVFQHIAYKVAPDAKGKGSKQCCVGKVLTIQVGEREVTVHKYAAVFDSDLRIKWKPLVVNDEGQEVVDPGAVSAQETLSVQRVIMKVELLKHGVLNHAAARRLDNAGYKFARHEMTDLSLVSDSLKVPEEWWKELVQPSVILAGEVSNPPPEVPVDDPKWVMTEFEIPGKALTSAEIESLAKEATKRWAKAGAEKAWDEVKAPLDVYRFSGVQLSEDPRRTEAYRAQVLAGCDLKHLKPEEVEAVKEVLARKAGAFWVPGTPRTTILHTQHDVVPSAWPPG